MNIKNSIAILLIGLCAQTAMSTANDNNMTHHEALIKQVVISSNPDLICQVTMDDTIKIYRENDENGKKELVLIKTISSKQDATSNSK